MYRRMIAFVAVAFLAAASAQVSHAQDWDRAVSLYNQKQYRDAIREFHALLRAYPEYWQSWYYVGAGHFQLQSYEDSIDAFKKYIEAAEKDEKGRASGLYFLGLAGYQLKRYDDAIRSLTEYISLSERIKEKVEPTARAALGRSYIFTDRFNEAVPVLTVAAAEIKNDPNNYYFLGFAQSKLGRTDQAIAALNQAVSIDPKDVDSLTLLTNIHLSKAGQDPASAKRAITTGEKLLAASDDQRSWGLLGQGYLVDGQYAKAVPLLDKYARANPESSSAWFNLGLAHSRSDQWKPAALALETTVKLAPTNAAAHLELGYVYERDRQLEKALAAYQSAYKHSGNKDETALASIERVKQSLSQP